MSNNNCPASISATAACREEDCNMYFNIFSSNPDNYYRFKIRKYYHFEPMTLVNFTYEPRYMGSIFARFCQSEIQLVPVRVDAKSIFIEHIYSVHKINCPHGFDTYIKDNLEKLTNSSIWYDSDRQALDLYVTELNQRYNIDLDESSLKYTNQYCWEVMV